MSSIIMDNVRDANEYIMFLLNENELLKKKNEEMYNKYRNVKRCKLRLKNKLNKSIGELKTHICENDIITDNEWVNVDI
jgi:hypothetical protein